MIREIVENIEDKNELLGFSKAEKAEVSAIASAVKADEKSLKTPSDIFILLQKLAKAGNKRANSELKEVGSEKSWAVDFVKKWLKKK